MNNKLEMARQFIKSIPHSQDLGMDLLKMADGMAIITMPYNINLIGDPETGVISGGAVSALIDTCCGAAVMSHPLNLGGTRNYRFTYRLHAAGNTWANHKKLRRIVIILQDLWRLFEPLQLMMIQITQLPLLLVLLQWRARDDESKNFRNSTAKA